MPGLDFIFGKTASFPLLLSQCHTFILKCRGSVHPALNFFRGNYAICSCIFVVSIEGEMSSGHSYTAFLTRYP